MDLYIGQKRNISSGFVESKSVEIGKNIGDLHNSRIQNTLAKQTSKEGMDITKGIEFIKTGKDVADALDKKIQMIKVRKAILLDNMNTLQSEIGFAPDDADNIGYDSFNEVPSEDKIPVYKIDYSNMKISGSENVQDTKAESDVVSKKQKYNSLSYRVGKFESTIKRMERMIKNLSATQKVKLSEYELENYGL